MFTLVENSRIPISKYPNCYTHDEVIFLVFHKYYFKKYGNDTFSLNLDGTLKSLIITSLLCLVDTVVLEKLRFTNACVSIVNNMAAISCQALCVSILLRCCSSRTGDFSSSLKRSCSALGLGGVTYRN